MAHASEPDTYVGRSMKRREDRRLLLGAGRYVDDVRSASALTVALVRSPHGHARVTRLDVQAAHHAPGVVMVVTGSDVRHLGLTAINRGPLPDMKVPPHPIIAEGAVRATGEPVAAIVAESAAAAWDAAERVQVDYEPLPAVPQPEAAIAPGAPVLYPEIAGNRPFRRTLKAGDPDGAFARAAHHVALRIAQERISAVPIEPRTVLATFDPTTAELTLWSSCQAPFRVRSEIARLLELHDSQVRVIAPDVGGGFGVKTGPYREEVLLAWLAVRLGRPVRWVGTRREDFETTNQARGSVCEAELALDGDGRILGLRAHIVSPLGASLMFAAPGSPWNHARLLPGAYVVPSCDITFEGALTNSTPVSAYRGAGRPEACFAIERLMDTAAHGLKLDPAEIRRRNLIPPDRFPFRTITGQSYDSGSYPEALERALAAADYPALRRAQEARRARGEIVGVGLASYVEPCALGWESGAVKVERSGRVTAITGSSAHGQGHETTFAQVVADALGVTPDDVTVVHGDTRTGPEGFGTFGSRSTALGGGALVEAAVVVRAKGRRIAAKLLEAGVDDVVAVPGGFHVVGAPQRKIAWREVAAVAYAGGAALPAGDTPGLESSTYFQPEAEVWSSGAVVAAVSIEADTGRLVVESLVWVDDAGTIINPLLAEGQLHGGLAQGFGQVVMEQIVYDERGQLLTGTLMDYAVPRADDVPAVTIEKMHTASPRNPLGAKGLGEAGCIAIPPALVNAVVDALSPFGVTHLDMPLTPEKLWRAMRR
ncbi:MAG: xanthine dehydrogenase family protein molybdopterin-binding subunit [Candidatus Rokubacteria bacterium]|nr:xanthine dehydrogenase family protein molybdopterin-binding subunit [Candidatus Rokubacteria bacterium]